jgi:drug/metabolite transporter (DMT)-like permease
MESSIGADPPTPSLLRANLATLSMALIWALNFSIAKDALSSISPLAFNALRFPLAALVVTAGMVRRVGFRLPAKEDRIKLLLLGLLSNVAYQLLFIYGLAFTRAGTASVLLSGTPIVTALLSAMIGHEHVSGRVWIGAMATVVGIVLVVIGSPAPAAGESAFVGDVLLIAATFAWAIYTVAARNLIRKYGALPVTAWTLWAGTFFVVMLGLPALRAANVGGIAARGWFAIIYAGALSIGVAYVLWSYGVRHLGPTKTATYSNLVPVFALAAAWLLIDERPAPAQIAGALIIIAGVTAAQLRRRAPAVLPRVPTP